MEQQLRILLDDFLDIPEDEELEENYIDMLRNHSVYSFLSVLYRIKYERISELLDRTKELVFKDRSYMEMSEESE